MYLLTSRENVAVRTNLVNVKLLTTKIESARKLQSRRSVSRDPATASTSVL